MEKRSNASQPTNKSKGGGVDFDKMWGSYQKNLKYQEKLDSESFEINPIAGFVAEAKLYWLDKKGKYMKSKDGDKLQCTTVFINICSSFLVSEPSMESNPDADPQDPETHYRLRVPVACGPAVPVQEPDNSICVAYDACFNTCVLEQAAKENDYKNFVCDLAAQNIAVKEANQKTPIEIKGPFKILKIPYKGLKGVKEPLKQRIRKKGISKIQEVSKSPPAKLNLSSVKYCPTVTTERVQSSSIKRKPDPKKPPTKKGLKKKRTPDTPRHHVGVVTKSGEVQTFKGHKPSELSKIVIAIDLEKCECIDNISLKLASERILRLSDKSSCYNLELYLPLTPLENGSCSWNRKKKILFCCFKKFK